MMKLSWSPTSPYVRKATALIIERGLEDKVERVPTNPWDDADPLTKTNPIGKVPCLTLEDGTALTDSPLICEYLDSLPGGPKLFPAEGPARWQALRLQALADGMMDSGISWLIERVRRPAEFRWSDWQTRQRDKILRILDTFEGEAKAGHLEPLTIGPLTLACGLGHLDFRFDKDVGWRNGRPALTAWYEKVAERPSLKQTMPKDPT